MTRRIGQITLLLLLAFTYATTVLAAEVRLVDSYQEKRGMINGYVEVYEHSEFVPGHWVEERVPVWKYDNETRRWNIVDYELTRIWIPPHTQYWITRRWFPNR